VPELASEQTSSETATPKDSEQEAQRRRAVFKVIDGGS
jgi:hypothetical protein